MWLAPQCINHKNINPSEKRYHLRRELLKIGCVAYRFATLAELQSGTCDAAMGHVYKVDPDVANGKRAG
jgi:hypothetical protein